MNINAQELAKLGSHLKGLLSQFMNDRQPFETQWLKNLRQHLGQYDPEILNNIPAERSHVYPRDTRVKVKGGVAKMMEMMFPSQDRNWTLSVSPNPSIPKDALQTILDSLQAQQEPGQPIASEAIEREVRKFADGRKARMEAEIADQLSDAGIDYPQLCKKVVRSGFLFGPGLARCPMVRTQEERVWEPDTQTGSYMAKTVTKRRPYPEFVRIWDFYPDLSAKNWEDQEMAFERFIFTRHDFRQLGTRKDFMAGAVKEYLKNHPTGNYAAKAFETDLQVLAKTTNLADRTARRYEVYRCLGFVSAHTLAAAGVEVKEDEMDQDILADLWFIDDVVVKAEKAAFGDRPSDQYHPFIYAEDEDSGLTGVGLPEEVRDSQMSICASTRALMDNMAATAGPILEVNVDLLAHGRKSVGPIHAFMTVERTGDGVEAQYPAVRDITTQSHIPEILNIIQMQRQQLDIESNLPAYTMGAMNQQPLGEAFRTSNNMSMMMGGANMVTKDTVRAFDKFTTSLINSMLRWNMEFNPDESIKGDYQAVAKGNQSLVAKEVRGQALDQFMSTLDEEEKAILDRYGLLIDRLKSRDLPTDRVLPEDEARQVLQQLREGRAQAAQIEQGLTQAKTDASAASAEKTRMDAQMTAASADAVIREILSRIEINLSAAKSSQDKNQLENLKVLLSTAAEPKKEKA